MQLLPRRPRLGARELFVFSLFWIIVGILAIAPTANRIHFDLVPLIVLAAVLMLIGCVIWYLFVRD